MSEDYLTVDDPISGQNYVCISFISPESLIQDKQAFKAIKFLQSYFKTKELNFQDVYEEYKDFVYKYEDKIQQDFDKENDYKTNIRGVKIRGVFDTIQAAQERAKKLIISDSNIHTFVGQMGYWLPWDPNADKVKDQVFQNEELNNLMQKYQENCINKDIFYEQEKRDKLKAHQEELIRKKKEMANNKALDLEPEPEPEYTHDCEPEPSPEYTPRDCEPEPDGAIEPNTTELFKNEVDKEMIDSLSDTDPWLKNKK